MSKFHWLPYEDSEHGGLGILLTINLVLITICVPIMAVGTMLFTGRT